LQPNFENMTIESFLAGKGDSFLLAWEQEDATHRILIDAGIPGIEDTLSAQSMQ
jgi:hypothetical protein